MHSRNYSLTPMSRGRDCGRRSKGLSLKQIERRLRLTEHTLRLPAIRSDMSDISERFRLLVIEYVGKPETDPTRPTWEQVQAAQSEFIHEAGLEHRVIWPDFSQT